jgi:hypothetical protein
VEDVHVLVSLVVDHLVLENGQEIVDKGTVGVRRRGTFN